MHEPYGSSGADTLTLKVISPLPPAGTAAPLLLRLTAPDGRPVTPADLIVAHTEKLHLLIVDETLTDYHHEHPKPTETPGEYRFDFKPRFGGVYHVWADVVPTSTGKQQYCSTKMQIAGDRATREQTVNRTAEVNDLRFDLDYDAEKEPLRVGSATFLHARVSQKDGSAFTQLEPVMGAFAHMVAFPTTLDSIAHVHPLGEEPTQPSQRGGPLLDFAFVPEKAGYYKIFLQTQIGGSNRFAAFGIEVAEALPVQKGAPTVFVCPMHPEVRQAVPGSCPSCGMALINK